MASHGKLRKDRGPQMEYENQVKEMRGQLSEQLRCLDSQVELRLQLLQDLSDFLRRRADVELEYSRGLEKLADRFSARTRGSKEYHCFRKDQSLLSPVTCWYMILNQTRQESRNRAALGEVFSGHLTQRLNHLSEDMMRLAKKSKDMGLQVQEELIKVVLELQLVMRTYQVYHGESLAAEHKLRDAEKQEEKRTGRSAEQGGNVSGTDSKNQKRGSLKKGERLVVKRQVKFQDSQLKCTKARNDYLLNLSAVNASVNNYYIRDVSDLIDCCDLGFHLSLGRALRVYLSAESQVQASHQESLGAVRRAVEGLDTFGDKAKVMEANCTAFCPPLKFEFQPHEGDEVCDVRVESTLCNELLARFQQIQSRLSTVNIETEEVNKTLKATLQPLLDLMTADDWDVLEAFQSSRSTESLKSTGSDPGSKQSIAKRRANQQETESFYLLKFQEYLNSRSLSSKLEAKHEQLKEAIKKALVLDTGLDGPLSSSGKSQRLRKRPSSQYIHKLFNGDLEQFIQSSGQRIPLVMESCIRFINLHGLQHEGIFRVSGSQIQVNEIRDAFEMGEDPLLDGYSEHDVDSVAGVLKLYLRGFQKPLFPQDLFDDLLHCVQIEDMTERTCNIKKVIMSLPSQVLVVLRYLFAFLNHLSQYSDENMMDPYNLSVCFGPTLVSVPQNQDPVFIQAQVNELVKTIIIYQEQIFPGPMELEGPVYEKCMTVADDNYSDIVHLEPTIEEVELEPAVSEEEPDAVEAVARFDYTARTPQELSFKKGETLLLQEKASSDWWRGRHDGIKGLIPHKYVILPDKMEQQNSKTEVGDEPCKDPSPMEEQLTDLTSRLRVNSDGAATHQKRAGNSSISRVVSPFTDSGKLPFPMTYPGPKRLLSADRQSLACTGGQEKRCISDTPTKGHGSPKVWHGINTEHQGTEKCATVEVDKDVTKNMNSVFKELLGKTAVKKQGDEEGMDSIPEPSGMDSSQPTTGRKGIASGGGRMAFGLRSKGLFKPSGGAQANNGPQPE
ncbi:rho GTPase-activating protein 4 [Microcaecilia unicolor]|uniref:Rho GTPase-activating protein 4 n=1 Tax=Microcaecilia unicolor TaxID=1415580 RepID=A0A6P7XI44_9AMPH|nr:rho GTPase-activating protein 4 [Microcaecilia unicolor]